MHEAKTNLSRLVERAMAGERIIIARNGKELLVLQPLENVQEHRRTAGAFRGKGKLTADFDAPLPEDIIREFE